MEIDAFTVREARKDDLAFVVGLIRENLKSYFEETSEGWSEEKLHSVDIRRIKILQCNRKRAGFFDYEIVDLGLYCRNIQIAKEFRGSGVSDFALIFLEEEASRHRCDSIYGKIFKKNRSVLWALRKGYEIIEVLPEENSYGIRKELN